MYNQAAFKQQQGIDDAMHKGVKNEELVGDYAYEGGWSMGVRRLPVSELAGLLDEYGLEALQATWNIVVDGD